MSAASAALFRWVQGAPFYQQAHRAAVSLLAQGQGQPWLDVGCGPGLMTRLAYERGYAASGIDSDPNMILAARRHPGAGGCRFEVSDLGAASGRRADVVSAASLLFVLPDPGAGLRALWRCVNPGGTLLVVETTPKMTPAHARRAARDVAANRRLALRLWAQVRQGRTVDRALIASVETATAERHALLNGLLEAWVLRKAEA